MQRFDFIYKAPPNTRLHNCHCYGAVAIYIVPHYFVYLMTNVDSVYTWYSYRHYLFNLVIP